MSLGPDPDVDQDFRAMRIGRQAATFYVSDDVVSQIDDRIALAVDRHRAIDLDAERRRRRR